MEFWPKRKIHTQMIYVLIGKSKCVYVKKVRYQWSSDIPKKNKQFKWKRTSVIEILRFCIDFEFQSQYFFCWNIFEQFSMYSFGNEITVGRISIYNKIKINSPHEKVIMIKNENLWYCGGCHNDKDDHNLVFNLKYSPWYTEYCSTVENAPIRGWFWVLFDATFRN